MENSKPEVTAIGYQVVFGVSDRCQITFNYFMAHDATDEAVNADLDRIMRIASRQSTILEAPKLREERAQIQGQLDQAREDDLKIVADFEAGETSRTDMIETLNKNLIEVRDEAYNNHVTTGRRSEFKPIGKTKAQMDNIIRDIFNLTQERERLKNEHTVSVSQRAQFITNCVNRIAHLDEKLAALPEG